MILISALLGTSLAAPASVTSAQQSTISAQAKAFSGQECTGGYSVKTLNDGSMKKLSEINLTYNGRSESIRASGGKVTVKFEADKGLLRIYTVTGGKGYYYHAQFLKEDKKILIHQCTV
ncbi:hypothetical protein [Deinococcus hopiensis]|uniref:Uncharacterized protein n=1 Tax=Deinococcus hopiensis KR-140 TaxID=695939 RepID=A0A1W1UYW5_9DEIO|nr:hypothetical protein [Deinococcus hopiensis]SMB86256.1 hypothetical protein SAMN00790413_03742 [Deinococcus hopiensis KR-140]